MPGHEYPPTVTKRRLGAVLLAVVVTFAGACTKPELHKIDVALAAPPVDLRAVPGGVAGRGEPDWRCEQNASLEGFKVDGTRQRRRLVFWLSH